MGRCGLAWFGLAAFGGLWDGLGASDGAKIYEPQMNADVSGRFGRTATLPASSSERGHLADREPTQAEAATDRPTF